MQRVIIEGKGEERDTNVYAMLERDEAVDRSMLPNIDIRAFR